MLRAKMAHIKMWCSYASVHTVAVVYEIICFSFFVALIYLSYIKKQITGNGCVFTEIKLHHT